MDNLFILKTILAKLWVEVIIFTFSDAVATVDVLTASNNDVNREIKIHIICANLYHVTKFFP